jgi:hypothetical protein
LCDDVSEYATDSYDQSSLFAHLARNTREFILAFLTATAGKNPNRSAIPKSTLQQEDTLVADDGSLVASVAERGHGRVGSMAIAI